MGEGPTEPQGGQNGKVQTNFRGYSRNFVSLGLPNLVSSSSSSLNYPHALDPGPVYLPPATALRLPTVIDGDLLRSCGLPSDSSPSGGAVLLILKR
ncbi:hypothetical protein MLD38_009303 [Melastoma candidum]|uniref:Uncharacterized protein n=1 Tax=Melastoma candidum TaxID=119954 RepID=A0ACB9RXB5_9MYRT|nr:hypothetical protein MLD38_009303 [Melastoma candidum]